MFGGSKHGYAALWQGKRERPTVPGGILFQVKALLVVQAFGEVPVSITL
jgi:hypothetical protein